MKKILLLENFYLLEECNKDKCMIKKFLIKIIKLYKKTPGKWHSACKFFPTCSSYAIEALEKHGALKGVLLIIMRLLRCNPWSKGGYYPVPEKFSLRAKQI